jgi:O-succinylbenzoate synthase
VAPRSVRLDVPEAVDAVELLRIRLPLVEPFVASHGAEVERDLTLVHVRGADGVEGWGECDALAAATYTREDSEHAWAFLAEHAVADVLAGASVDVAASPMAWTALEVAFLDLTLRREGMSLAAHVGATHEAVPCGVVIGRRPTIDALLAAVAGHVAEGVALVKLKIGAGWDVEPLRAVRQAYPTLALCADANGAYDAAALGVLDEIDALHLTYLEQPFPPSLAADLDHLIVRLSTPIALDESITTSDDIARFSAAGLVVNVKPARLGGVAEARRAIARCADGGIGAFVGGMLEGGIGRAVGLALAGIDSLTHPTDLGPSSRYFDDDITEPFELSGDGLLAVPQSPGIGVVPRADRLDALVVDRVTIRR